jgi:hypothetical protein
MRHQPLSCASSEQHAPSGYPLTLRKTTEQQPRLILPSPTPTPTSLLLPPPLPLPLPVQRR